MLPFPVTATTAMVLSTMWAATVTTGVVR